MQLFLHNLGTLIPNLPHAPFCLFSYSKFKNKMAAKICENVPTLHHGLGHNEHNNIISVFKITFLGSGNSVMMFLKVI